MLHSLAYIPSPSFNEVRIGAIHLRLYGLCIALGVIVAVSISGRRWEKRGGQRDDIAAIATWAVPAGVVGARMYHVATDWKTYFGAGGHPIDSLKIWNGGLGIPGGVLAGVLVGLWVARRKKLPGIVLLDVVAPTLPIAQAIGRFGNYFNQELFGRPTKLPWGLRIDVVHRPVGYTQYATFHPTFLYEALWNVGLATLLIWLDKKRKLHVGELFTLYVLGYAVGRWWVEDLRIDKASLIFGIRINLWVSGIVAIVTLLVFLRNRRHPSPALAEAGQGSGSADAAGGVADAGDSKEAAMADATAPDHGDEPTEVDPDADDQTAREALELELMDDDASDVGKDVGEHNP